MEKPQRPKHRATLDTFRFHPIGIVRSCFTDKFGIPRQPGLASAAEAKLELFPDYSRAEAVAGLSGFSHVWLIFVFHDCVGANWKPMVRPPRLGGNRKVGVFASRAPYRPNPIGLSAVKLAGVERDGKRITLRLRGADLLDGTPVLDVKPYVPYADALPDAAPGFAAAPPDTNRQVEFSPQAQRQLLDADPEDKRRLSLLIDQILRQDPRPGYMDKHPRRTDFGMRLYELDVKWRMRDGHILVTAVIPVSD